MKATPKWYRRWLARRRAVNQTIATAEEWLRTQESAANGRYLTADHDWSYQVGRYYADYTGIERPATSLAERTGLEPLAAVRLRDSQGRYTTRLRAEQEYRWSDPDYVSPAVIAASRTYAASAELLGDPPSDPTVFGDAGRQTQRYLGPE
jgi:hypothetical protein